jgi:hypothetical protein
VIPIPASLVVIGLKVLAVVAVVGAVIAIDRHRLGVARDEGRAEVQSKWNAEREQQKDSALRQAAANAEETARRLRAQKEAQDVHDKEVARARADADAARAAAGRLSRQLAEFAAAHRAAARDPAAVGNREAAADPLGMLAELLGRIDERAGILAAYADAARAAGLQCERSYEALTTP